MLTHSSERMFKARLRSWKVRKNCTTKEMARAVKIINDRTAIGKETTVRIRGLEIDATKLRKFRNRNRQANQELLVAGSSRSTTPSDISCFTPRHDPIDVTAGIRENSPSTDTSSYTAANAPDFGLNPTNTALVTAQTHDYFPEIGLGSSHDGQSGQAISAEISSTPVNPELWNAFTDPPLSTWTDAHTLLWDEMFISMKSYFEFYFGSPAWESHSTQPVNFDGDEIQNPRNNDFMGIIEVNNAVFDFKNPGSVVTLYEVACLLFQRGDAEAADRFIRQASELIELLLKEEHPQLLSCLFLVVCILEAKDRRDLVDQLLDFTHWASASIHGKGHLIPRIISCCARAVAEDCSSAAEALRGTVITFERLIGGEHSYTLRLRHIHAWGLFQQNQFEPALKELRGLGIIYKLLAGDDHIHSRHVLFATAQIYMAQGKFDDAEATFREVYRLSEQKYGRDPPAMINLECLRMLAVVYRRQEKFEEVIPILCKALPVGIKLLGKEHPTMLLIWHDLKKMWR